MGYYRLLTVTEGDANSKQIRNSNATGTSKIMNLINRIGLIFIIDFFETSIDEGYDRECHIGKSTDGRGLIQPVIKIDHVHKQRRGINQAVNPIQNSAMTRNRHPHVLDPNVAFDDADG
jgi:hypothetical protein